MSKTDRWKTISLAPLSGQLDTRSRPADIPVGAFRWKQNWAVSPDGKLCRRGGYSRAFADLSVNGDHHSQGANREAITFAFESTGSDGTRRFFDGTQSRVSLLDETAGTYTDILSGFGSTGSRWHAAELQDYVLFTNNTDPVQAYALAGGPANPILELASNRAVSAARVIASFKGFILLMNVVQDGTRSTSKIVWNDLNLPLSWDLNSANTLAGFQDLDYGDEILAAVEMVGSLYIFTRRSIWRCDVSGSKDTVFTFTKVYTEKKNQRGCLVYPNTLVSTGTEVWYASREAFYRYNPYLIEPERTDWMYRASGVVFRKGDTALSGENCDAPIAEYEPTTNELWFSWPASHSATNNWTLVAQTQQQTADVVEAGFTCFAHYRRNPSGSNQCNEGQDFIAASSADWCLKSIGGVFYREYATTLPDLTVDIPIDLPHYFTVGYNSILRGIIPLGFADREKTVRNVLIDHDTSEQDHPCMVTLRIGNSFNAVDPNDTDNICAPQWRNIPWLDANQNEKLGAPLACVDGDTISALTAKGEKPAIGMEWRCYEQNRFLFWEVVISNADGSAAVGGDSCFSRIDFDCSAMPKP